MGFRTATMNYLLFYGAGMPEKDRKNAREGGKAFDGARAIEVNYI